MVRLQRWFSALFSIAVVWSCLVVLAGCHSVVSDRPAVSRLSVDELMSGTVILERSVTAEDLPEDRVTALTPEIRSFLDRHIDRTASAGQRLRRLIELISASGKVGFEYDSLATRTAQETFEHQSGNCLAFSYLFVGMARYMGIPADYQHVDVPPAWSDGKQGLVMVSSHVNVRIPGYGGEYLVVDSNAVNIESYFPTRVITDAFAEALYYSNKSAELMGQGEFMSAFLYNVKALKLEPEEASLWSNLGVIYRRAGFPDYAEAAYLNALKDDPGNHSAMNNLHTLYRLTEQPERAEHYRKLAKVHQRKNPYYHYYRAQHALQQEELDEALVRINTAIKRRANVPDFYRLQQSIYQRLGNETSAQEALSKALALEVQR